MPLLSILIAIIIIGVILWAARALIGAFGIQNPIATVIYVVLVLIILIWVLGWLGVAPILRIN